MCPARAMCLLTGQHRWVQRGTDGFAVPRYTQSRSTHLPMRGAKENAQTYHNQM